MKKYFLISLCISISFSLFANEKLQYRNTQNNGRYQPKSKPAPLINYHKDYRHQPEFHKLSDISAGLLFGTTLGLFASVQKLPPPPSPRFYPIIVREQYFPEEILQVPAPIIQNSPIYSPGYSPIIVSPIQCKVWVEGYWKNEVDIYGRMLRVWVPGHFEVIFK